MKKNPSSSKKPRRSKSSQKRLQRKLQKTHSSTALDYGDLEQRYALDASLAFDNGELDLFGFDEPVTISQTGNTVTANLQVGTWTLFDNGDPVDPADLPANIIIGGGMLEVNQVDADTVVDVDLNGNSLTFEDSNFGNRTVTIDGAGRVDQLNPIRNGNDGSISISGNEVDLTNVDNAIRILNVEAAPDANGMFTGNVSVFSTTSISGDTFSGENVDVDAAEIEVRNVTTPFVPVEADFNQIGAMPASSVRLRATGGETAIQAIDPVTMMPIGDAPILRENSGGGITITGNVVSDQILLQSSNGIDSDINAIDTLYLFLGGDLETESRGEFQLNVPSLQQLSANLYDSFAITSEQDLTIGAFQFTGTVSPNATPLPVFTEAYSDQYSNVTAVSLTFDAPFESQKLIANVTTTIDQTAGAALDIDDLHLTAETVVLNNVNNDFQRIAGIGRGFLVGDLTNNEDNFIIRDQGTLEIAVLDTQPDDELIIDFAIPIATNPLEGITVAGQLDILTGLGGPVPVQPVDAVEPSFAQLGNTAGTDFRIERFEIPRERSGTQTGIFRDDNYNGSERPVYFIEFFYDGTQDLAIRTDEFERGNPEPVRNFIDVELGLYNDLGELVAVGTELARELEEIAFAAGTLPAGRYFVAASAFSTQFQDDFVVNTANTQTGTLNVTINGHVPVTPELSRDLTQADRASLTVFGGNEPIPEDSLLEFGPDDFPPEVLTQLDPNAADFVPEPVEVDNNGNPITRVGGRATLGAANGGTVELALLDDNAVRELVISEAGAVEYADIDDLVVSSLDATGQSLLAAGRGGTGELIVGDVDSSTLLLQAASGVSQEGAITTDQLLLGGSLETQAGGDFVIHSDTLENVAFNLPFGNLALTTSQALNIGFVQFNDIENPLVPSFIFDESVVSGKARIEAASININTQVQAETLVLNAEDSIVQGSPVIASPGTPPELIPSVPSIVAPNLSISATTVDLDQPANSFTRLAGNVTGSLDLLNSNPIVVASIDNTVETETRLRPVGVTQTFGPLETINGLTVTGTASITTGLDDEFSPVAGGFSQEAGAPLNIASANFTALGDGDIFIRNNGNDINFNTIDARDVTVELIDEATVSGLTANRDLLIESVGDVTIGELSAGRSITVNSGGSINEAEGTLSSAGTITLNAVDDINGIDFADQSVVTATSTAGDISLVGVGDLTLLNLLTDSGSIGVTTAGDVLVGSVTSASTIDVDSGGSINDLQGDLVSDFTAAGLVTLVAVDEIGGGTAPTVVDSAGQLEFAEGTASVESTEGEIVVGGTGPLVFGDLTTSEDLIISSPVSVTLGDVTALSATITAMNDVTVANVTTVNETTITTNGAIETGDITATSIALDAGTSLDAGDLNASLGNVDLKATKGLTTGDVAAFSGDVIIDSGNGNLNAGRVVSNTGTVSLTSLQRVNAREALALGDVTLEAGSQVNTDLVVSATGSATINANGNLSAKVVEAEVDAILIAPRSDVYSDSVTAGTSAQLSSGAYLFTRNVEAPVVSMIAGTNQIARRVIADTAEITAVGDLGLNDIQVGQLTIEAGDDIFDAGFLDGKRVTTDDLVIRVGNSNDEETFGGVVLETDVDTLSVVTEGNSFGNIIIRELDDIVLGDIEAANGGINIAAGGTISGGNLRTLTQSDSNDVRLIATGDASDIRVDSIDVGNIGDAFLIADDDVVITGDANQVTADFMFVWARNRSAGDTDGIALSTNAVTTDLVVGDIADATQNRGDISITDVDTLNVNFARTLNGTISATANGNLVANNIQSAGVNVSDAISLTAIGTGADVVTNRVVVVQQAGGIVMTADDDVRDANPRDNRLVIADNLTMVARNNLNDTFNGINSQSRVKSINAIVDSSQVIPDGNQEGLREASILLNNIGQLTVNEANVNGGLVRVINNNGFLTINDISLSSTSSDNRVFVQTTGNGSDIAVGKINAGSRGTVTIDSADDIFDTDQLDELFVQGRFLSATSRNGTDNPFDGIVLNVDVDSFVADAQLDGEAFVRQRG